MGTAVVGMGTSEAMEASSECIDFVATVTGSNDSKWTARLEGRSHEAKTRSSLWACVQGHVKEVVAKKRHFDELGAAKGGGKDEPARKDACVECAGLEMWVSEDGGAVGATSTPECPVRTWYIRAHIYYGRRTPRGRPRSAYHHHPAVRMLDDDLQDAFRHPSGWEEQKASDAGRL